jgi:hypothetical protein
VTRAAIDTSVAVAVCGATAVASDARGWSNQNGCPFPAPVQFGTHGWWAPPPHCPFVGCVSQVYGAQNVVHVHDGRRIVWQRQLGTVADDDIHTILPPYSRCRFIPPVVCHVSATSDTVCFRAAAFASRSPSGAMRWIWTRGCPQRTAYLKHTLAVTDWNEPTFSCTARLLLQQLLLRFEGFSFLGELWW